jgi:hypothetical protein
MQQNKKGFAEKVKKKVNTLGDSTSHTTSMFQGEGGFSS